MRKIYSVFTKTLLIFLLAGCAQNNFRKANMHFENMAYSKAIIQYEKSLEKKQTPAAMINLAESYRLTNNTVKAEAMYREVVGLPVSKFNHPEHKLYFAEALKSNEKYEEASEWLREYLKEVPDDRRAANLLKYCDSVSIFHSDASLFTVMEIPVNSKESNFSPAFLGKGIVFCSERSPGKLKFRNEWTGNAFLDLYYSEPLDSGGFSEPVRLGGAINSIYHEGPASFTANGTEVYFTRNNINKNKPGKSKDNVTHLKICKASLIDDKWSGLEDFPYNSSEYSVGHPAVSPDGKLLFFVSDVPGGFGGTDIYVSRLENGKWSSPENMGRGVNTEGNESFPFYFNNGENEYLFFSSNGRPGLGGLDIYRADLSAEKIEEPVHLSAPVNSPKDDFGFIIDREYKSGYFSSNRDSLVDKIYSFTINEPEYALEAAVFNTISNAAVSDATITLVNISENRSSRFTTDNNGRITARLDKGSDYRILVNKENFIPDTIVISTVDKRHSHTFNEKLNLKPVIRIRCRVINKATQQPLTGIPVTIFNMSRNEGKIFQTGKDGFVEYDVEANYDYHILVRKEKFFAGSLDFSTANKTEPEIMEINLELEPIVLNKVVRMDNIYYDYNKWDIREDAGAELDKLVRLLEENPEIRIELGSHSDSRGADAYNLKLSQKRAEAAAQYIVSKGISPGRIVAKGYGETKLLNKCGNGISCSEEEHSFNRRTEFKVIKIGTGK